MLRRKVRAASADLVPLIVADIFELAGAFRDQGETIARAVGQTQARWQVLSAASADPKTVPQIARRLGVTRQSVQRLANALVRDGSARFKPNPDHKGSPYLELTEKGRSALARLGARAGAHHRSVAVHFGRGELGTLHEGLRALIAALARSERNDSK